MTRFQRVVQILDEAVGGPAASVSAHGAFWRGITRDQLLTKKVFGHALIVGGQGRASNLVKALKDEAPFGSDLDDPPPGAEFSRMPSGFPPVPNTSVAFIQKWIDNGCPEDPSP